MRIVYFTDTFLPEKNGVAISLGAVVRELAARGHKICIVAPVPSGAKIKEPFRVPGVEVVRLPSLPVPFHSDFRAVYGGFRAATKQVRAFKPDVIHVQSIFAAGRLGRSIARQIRLPLIATNHIYVTADNVEFYSRMLPGPRPLASLVAHGIAAYTYRFLGSCDVSVVPSEVLLKGMRDAGYKKPLTFIPNPLAGHVSVPMTVTERKKRRKAMGIDGPVLMHVGRLSHEKSVDVVIRALCSVRKAGTDATLVIVGDGPARKSLESLAKSEKVTSHVRFMGSMDHDTLMQSGMLDIGDLFVTASATESQGMAVIEAMAFGLPIVAVAEGAIPEVVGDNGLLVPAGDAKAMAKAILRILTDAAFSKTLHKRSLLRAKTYSIGHIGDVLMGVYRELIDAGKPGRR